VIKMRGIDFRGGFHDFTIKTGGLEIYPRLVAAEHHRPAEGSIFAGSGDAALDTMLGGGLERGTNALLLGAAGVGKSSLALTYAIAAAGRGERGVIFAFDEGQGTMQARARTLGLPLERRSSQVCSASSRSIPPSSRRASSPASSGARWRWMAHGSW
jgi:circadian clock protein KaiC